MSQTPEHPAVQILKQTSEKLDAFFNSVLGRCAGAPVTLLRSMHYSLGAGGKRLRPALVIESFRACGGLPERSASALAAAAAIELIHTFSLVHDDLPAMDDDDLRRGRPTNHKIFGEAIAILAGDAMTTMAFELIASDADPAVVPALIRELAAASGPLGMIGGQVLDIEGENKCLLLVELRELHRRKTGALLTCAARMGAIAAAAPADTLQQVTDFGGHLGLAFQIIDDILDETSTPEQLGKATQKDRHAGKNTYPTLLGLAESRHEASLELEQALACIAPLGPRGESLRNVARFVVERNV
ncbi:MAG: polyprenyl synthetase family protein [Tepidisphaeraceae bacterium]